MLVPLLLGSLMIWANMGVEVVAVVLLVRHFERRPVSDGLVADTRIIGTVLLVLFAGHVVQIATWACLFFSLGEFADFDTAFYHSAVNFASLGYGDIVMSLKWRLLGPLEAANGALMFGLSAGGILSVMSRRFGRQTSRGQL